MKKVLVLLGHSDSNSFSAELATRYEEVAREAGFDVTRVNLGELQFDPILHLGYKEIQELEPDLLMIQERIDWADHIVIVYPNWWCTMPAILKGMFDRMWLPGFAFNFDKVSKKTIKRLKGKTARVLIVAGSHSPFMTWLRFGDFTNEIVHGTLGFAGIKTRVSAFGPQQKASEKTVEKWMNSVSKLASKGS